MKKPTATGNGYANILLFELLKKANERNIPRALVTCIEGNTASRRVIEYNGGELDRLENGECTDWIRLAEGNGIREIHFDDYSKIYDLWRKTSGMGLSDADSSENILKFLSQNKGMSFCYEQNQTIVGTILCGHDGRRGYIYHVTVDTQYRGTGIGRILVHRSLQKLKKGSN